MIRKILLINLILILPLVSIYAFINKDFVQNNFVQKIENQDSLPGGHFKLKDQNNKYLTHHPHKNLC